MRILQIKKNQRGVILLMTLLILSSVLVVSLGAASLVFAGIRMNRLTGYSGVAFFAAEAGLERSLWEVRKNGYILPPATELNAFIGTLLNGSKYAVDCDTPDATVTFKSTGGFQGVKRSVKSTYQVE